MKKVLLLLFVIVLSSCNPDEVFSPSTYPQLNGSYTFYSFRSWNNGLYEDSEYESWDFDKTCKAWHYYNNWSYTSSGWVNSSKKGTSFDKEWKVENGKFYEKLWDNQYSEWYSHTFEYINSTSFKLDGNLYTKD